MSQVNPQPSTVWTYNGVEMELDLTDVEVVERYEEVIESMDAGIKNLPKEGKQSEILKAYCLLMKGIFDDLFGEGTSTKMFGEKLNATQITEAYEDFLAFVAAHGSRVTEVQNRIVNRYSPNRAQRRANK